MDLILPQDYDPVLSVRETEEAIKYIRDTFQKEIGTRMNLERVSAPLFLKKSTGLNDDQRGFERKVSFDAQGIGDEEIEVVQSLAKWKRWALYHYGFKPGEGLYTNMNAIRRDEALDNLHSIYVDQWDWERAIEPSDRSEAYLRKTVRQVYKVVKHMEHEVWYKYPKAVYHLPEDVFFIDSEELMALYPDMSPAERENEICRARGAVFVMRIGDRLSDGSRHCERAPDYDDWELNGDLICWFRPLRMALKISSMGIRVNADKLIEQLDKAGCPERGELPFHRMILDGTLPCSIGGGIGQSKLCMLLLGRAHIGEVQVSVWPDEMRALCAKNHMILL